MTQSSPAAMQADRPLKHPLDEAIARIPRRDQKIADQLAEEGFSDEDLYAALPSPGADKLLNQPKKKEKRHAG